MNALSCATSSISPRRVVLYLRISLDATGEMLAVERQREDCIRICQERGWAIVGEFVDNSVSASDARKTRPGYDAMLKAFDAGEFDALVCYDLDRLTRQPRQLEDWIDRANSGSLLIVTANGEADLTTDGGMLFARIKLAVARGEVDRKSARQKRALQQRADKGKPPLGVRLTGYTTKGEIVEDEAATIRDIYSEFINGESLKGIAASLEAKGITTRHGRQWNPSSVQTILKNPRYAGFAIYQGETTGKAGDWTPIVSPEQFHQAQAILGDPRRKTNKVGTHRRHLGSGLYRCGDCGEPCTSWTGGRYRCASACLVRAQKPVDDYVRAVLHERLRQADILTSLSQSAAEETTPLQAEAKSIRERIQQIESDYDGGLIDGKRFAVATEKALASLKEVETKLGARRGLGPVVRLLHESEPEEAFAKASLMTQRAVLETLMVVTLKRGKRGSKVFDPASVDIEWVSAGV
jgi:site-specific DNA recombinase